MSWHGTSTCTDSCCRPEPGIYAMVLSRRSIKATRTVHTCAGCYREIPAGSRCQSMAAMVDGDFYTEYRHHPYDPACTDEPA